MASLKEVRNTSRHILAIGAIFIAGIFLISILINIGKAIIATLHPTPPPPPTVSFGKLPPISFPTSTTTNTFSFTLDTLSGTLPNFGDRATVYKIQPTQPNLLALNSAKALVAKEEFLADPVRISATEYSWTNIDPLPKTLKMNIFNYNFSLDSDFLHNRDVQQANNLPDQNGAINLATQYLQNLGVFPADIDQSKTKVTLSSITNNQLTPATSLSNTQVIRVDFFQNDVNNLPVFYPNATHSTMYFLIGGGNNTTQILEGHFTHQTISTDNGTYPIITAQQAFEALQKGEGYIASYDNTGTAITIHNVVMGYYLGDDPQQYLQPIIVFEGDHGFFGYVPAITSAWIQKQ